MVSAHSRRFHPLRFNEREGTAGRRTPGGQRGDGSGMEKGAVRRREAGRALLRTSPPPPPPPRGWALGASPPAPASGGSALRAGGGGPRGGEESVAAAGKALGPFPQALQAVGPAEPPRRNAGRIPFPKKRPPRILSPRRELQLFLARACSRNLISKMTLWTRQLSRCCPLLNAYNIMKSTELRKQSIKTWTHFLEPPDLQWLCPYRYFCQMLFKNVRTLHLNMQFCSSSTEPSQTSLSFTDKPKTEIASSLDTEVLLQDLEDELPSSALEEISEDEALQIKAAPPPPLESFSLKDYIDHSETLRQLVLLGVDLSRVEKRPNAGQLLVKLDFENDVKKILLFLKDIGLEDTQLGAFLTKNPYILNEEVEDLKTRVDYLISKKITKEAVTQMVLRAPYLLLFSVERLDNRLGYFQNEIGLNPRKTRNLIIRLPRLLTGKLEPIKENLIVYELELGFSKNEICHIVHTVPKNLSTSKKKLTQMFDYVHNVMGIPHKLMVLFPQIFNAKFLRIKERHLFLKFLGRAQYDPEEPSYISLEKLVALPDDVFCAEVAKAEVKDFEKFLKTL